MYELVSFSCIRDFPRRPSQGAAAQGDFYFFTNRTTISTMDARRCVAIVGDA